MIVVALLSLSLLYVSPPSTNDGTVQRYDEAPVPRPRGAMPAGPGSKPLSLSH